MSSRCSQQLLGGLDVPSQQVPHEALKTRAKLREASPIYRYVIFPLLGDKESFNGEWKSHPDDKVVGRRVQPGASKTSRSDDTGPRCSQGELMLEKHQMLIDGLRGELVVRRNATYEIDPLTRRINRWVLSRHGADFSPVNSLGVHPSHSHGASRACTGHPTHAHTHS